jgi:hypothetical protein
MDHGKPRVRLEGKYRIPLQTPDPIDVLERVERFAKQNKDPNGCYAMPCQWILQIAEIVRGLKSESKVS